MDAAPRGYAKSVLKTLFKPLHDICYGHEKYILFISATKPQALEKLKDIRSELLLNIGLLDVFDISFDTKNPGAEEFIVNTEIDKKRVSIKCHAIGQGTEIRGTRFRQDRPTKIILDDVEDSEEVDNEEIREKIANWYFEVVSNLGSEDTNIELVGTILHKKSLLKRLTKNPAYTSKIYKAVISWADDREHWKEWQGIYTNLDNDNRFNDAAEYFEQHKAVMLKGHKVLWPEKEPYDALMRQIIEKGKRAFYKEKQNDPMASDEALFDSMQWYHEDASRGGMIIESSGAFIPYEDLSAYGSIDPATGDTKAKNKKVKKLDFTCILGGYKDLRGRLLVHKDWTKRARPTLYLEQIFEHHEMMDFVKFVVETNLYRGLLIENLQRERKRREHIRKKAGDENWKIKVPFYEIENREKKEKRIFTLEPKVNHGHIIFNRTLSTDFIDMMENFPSKDAHDDGPDALEMLWGLINNRYKPCPIDRDVQGEL